jgi:hypothetical protein
MIILIIACNSAQKDQIENHQQHPFSDELVIDLQPNTWPNIITEDAIITVAILGRNGIEPQNILFEDIVISDSDDINISAPIADLGLEDIDGDDVLDRVIEFDYNTLVDAGILQDSGRVIVSIGELSAWDQYIDSDRPFFQFPEPSGEYMVGTIQYEWEDTSRIDETSDELPYRKLPIQVWYPAKVPSLSQPTDHYLNRDEGISLATGWGIFPRYYDYLYSQTYRRAPLSDIQDSWPVLIFSHGYGVQLSNQSMLVQNIASHGFIVVGVQHTYSTPVTIFQDGTVVSTYFNPASSDADELQNMWTKDQQFVLEQITLLADTDPLFLDRIDLNAVGVFGYSFGGSTAAELCRTDSRILAGLNIDGTFYGETEEGFEQDFFLINASSNFQDGTRESLLNSVRGQAYSLTIETAHHSNFDDFAIQGDYISELLGGGNPGLGIGSIDPYLGYDIVNQYILAFFQEHVLGEQSPLLNEAAPWDEVEFTQWSQSE